MRTPVSSRVRQASGAAADGLAERLLAEATPAAREHVAKLNARAEAAREAAREFQKALAVMPRREVHPLKLFLDERGVGMKDGARMLGWSLRKLQDIVAWRSTLPQSRAQKIAKALGFADFRDIVPWQPRELHALPGQLGPRCEITRAQAKKEALRSVFFVESDEP